MEMVKPEPLVIDGRPYYTLTSYEPVTVEVDVHDITEEDVEQAMAFAIAQNGGGPDRLNDDAWIRDKFEGMHGAAELKSTIRSEMEAANQEMMEGQVAVACASELAKRLVQRVTAEQVAAIRQDIEQSFEVTLAEQGATIDLVLAQTGGSRAELDAMFDKQATQTAEQEAAVSAWAQKMGVTVSDDELALMIGGPVPAGQEEKLRAMAIQSRAMHMIMDECSCTYTHDGGKQNDHPHLKLV